MTGQTVRPSFLTPTRQGKRPRPSMATPGSRDSINTAGTQDWVVTFRKLLHKVTNQDAQIKALKANHKNLVLEAASLQHALAKAEIIPTGELLTSLLSLDPRSDSEGCSP